MEFNEAIELMKEGKTFTRPGSMRQNREFIYLEDGKLKTNRWHTSDYLLKLETLEADDWEIFEENKTLYNKNYCGEVELEDVKEALQEFTSFMCFDKAELRRAKEIFGKELIE